MAVDERLRPVVVEFKRVATGTRIGQTLVYLDWMLAQRHTVA